MKLLTPIFAVTLLMFGFSSTASATFYHPKPHYCDNGQLCDNSQPFSTTLTTGDINNSGIFAYWSFDSIDVVDLEIESATLTVQNNANGWGVDGLYAYDTWGSIGYFDYVGSLDGGYDVFSLSSSLFDKVIDGLSLKALFSLKSEDVFWSKLEVSGVYCPPISEVPLPAAVWLFGSGLMGFMAVRRKAKSQQA